MAAVDSNVEATETLGEARARLSELQSVDDEGVPYYRDGARQPEAVVAAVARRHAEAPHVLAGLAAQRAFDVEYQRDLALLTSDAGDACLGDLKAAARSSAAGVEIGSRGGFRSRRIS